MPSDLEWDETICRETTVAPGMRYRQPTDRAIQECQKRLRAYMAVRQPQEVLDSRIIELATSGTMAFDKVPYLHYGLMVPPAAIEPCITRNHLQVPFRGTPEYSAKEDPLCALQAVEVFVESKGGLPLQTVFALEETTDHILFALDDTDTLRHRKFPLWDGLVGPALQAIRDELGLGDQKAMWWWDSQYGSRYFSPIPDYNPPQMNPKPKVSMIQSYDSDSYDSDSSDSDGESETE